MSARICCWRQVKSSFVCTGVPSLKTKGFGSSALLKPGIVDAVVQPDGLVPEGPVGGAEAVEETEEAEEGGGVGGACGEVVAVPGRHCE